MTDQSGIGDRDEASRDVSRRTRDEPVTGVEDGSIEIVDPSPMLRHLIEIAQQLNEDDVWKLVLRGRRMLRGTEE